MSLLGDVVAGQGDDVRFEPVCGVYGLFNLFAARKRTVMNIGKLNDAKTVKSLGQAVQLDTLMLNAEHVGLSERGTSNMRQAKSQGPQRSVRSFGTAIRRDTSTLVPSNRSRHILEFGLAPTCRGSAISGAHYRDLPFRKQLCNSIENLRQKCVIIGHIYLKTLMKRQLRRNSLIVTVFFILAASVTTAAEDTAGSSGHGFDPAVLIGVAVMLVVAKLGGELFERMRQPAVLGELVAGILLGNLVIFGFTGAESLKTNETIAALAELGVIILLFEVGLESDLREMMEVGWSSLLVAFLGVIAPFFLGWAVSAYFIPDEARLVHIFIGATLCARASASRHASSKIWKSWLHVKRG